MAPISVTNMGVTHQVNAHVTLNLLHKNLPPQKYFIIKFHKFFNALLGTEYLARCKGIINYENETLSLNDMTFKFKKYFINKPQTHLMEIKTSKNGDWVLPEPLEISNGTTIEPGVYRSEERKATVCINSLDPTTPLAPPTLKIKVNNFDIIEPIATFENKLDKDKIADLVRTNHLSPLEKNKIIDTIFNKQAVLLKQNEKVGGSPSFTHRILTTDDKPIYTKSYRYPQNFKHDVHKQIAEMLENGIIKNSKSPYSAPIWVVPKKRTHREYKRCA